MHAVNYGADPKKNCVYWEPKEREQRGCGTTCGCLKLEEDLFDQDAIFYRSRLMQDKQLGLDEISDTEYSEVVAYDNALIREQSRKNKEAEQIKNMFGGKGVTQAPRTKRTL